MKKLVYVLPLVAMFSATAATAATQQDAANAIVSAVQANNEIAKKGFEWRDTYKTLLGPAKKAYHNGNFDEALALANKAKAEAELGMNQYQASFNAEPRF